MCYFERAHRRNKSAKEQSGMNSTNPRKFFSTLAIVAAAMFIAMAVVLSYVKIDLAAT